MPDRPVETFSPELMRLITAATKSTVVIDVPNRSTATSLRYRFYHLRAKLMKSDAPHLRHMTRTMATILMNGEPWYPSAKYKPPEAGAKWQVRCQPADSDVNDYIADALKGVPDLEPSDEAAAPDLGSMIDTPISTLPDPDSENNA